MVITGAAETKVTWNWHAVASEDLIFGQRAAQAGLRWGWFHEYAEVTSPWTSATTSCSGGAGCGATFTPCVTVTSCPAAAAARVLLKYVAGVIGCCLLDRRALAAGHRAIPATAGILNFGKLALIALGCGVVRLRLDRREFARCPLASMTTPGCWRLPWP